MIITCCKRCEAPKRHLGCHSACQEYLAERAREDWAAKARRAEHSADEYEITRHLSAARRYGRRHRCRRRKR
nr:MAG TPA: hypothetical protein [Caudoviricetes sp.]